MQLNILAEVRKGSTLTEKINMELRRDVEPGPDEKYLNPEQSGRCVHRNETVSR